MTQLAWSVKAGFGDYPTVQVVDGLVWGVPTRDDVRALDLATGEERWRFPTKEVVYAPEVTDDAVYFATSDMQLHAVSRVGAEHRWSVPMPGMLFAAPVVAGGLVVAQMQDGLVLAFDVTTGEQRWRTALEGSGLDLCRPHLRNDRLLIAHHGGIAVLELATGKRIHDLGGHRINVMLDDGAALYCFASYGLQVSVHDRESGELKKTSRLPSELVEVLNHGAVADDGVIYCAASTDRRLVAIDTKPDAPRITWLPFQPGNRLTIADGALYLASRRELAVVHVETHAVMWSAPLERIGGFIGRPIVIDDMVVIPSEAGVVAVRRPPPPVAA
jgi:outer membrane protein assembly factor BamB